MNEKQYVKTNSSSLLLLLLKNRMAILVSQKK